MPAGYDAEVAELFQDLRAASGLSEAELAAQLATRVEVVQALEHGALYALPPWPETCRVVSTYGTMLNLDVRPLLQRIYAQLDAGIVELGPKSRPDVPVMKPPEDMNRDYQPPARPTQPQQRMAPQPAPPRQPGPPPQQRMAPQPAPPQWPQAQQPRPPQPQAPRGQPLPPQYQPQTQPQQPAWPQRPQGAPQQHPAQAAPKPAAPQPQPSPRQAVQPAVPRPVPSTPLAAEPPLKGPAKEAAAGAKPARKGFLRAPLLKWGLVALVASALLFGLWTWFAKPGLLGFSGPTVQSPAVTTDPNDPRSRKADRLPGPS
jgi:hypothetical protein